MHLKRIAGLHMLGLDLEESSDVAKYYALVDQKLGVNIQHVFDFAQLDGHVFKTKLLKMFSETPELNTCAHEFSCHNKLCSNCLIFAYR